MSICANCRREFPGDYPLYCSCGHVTGREAGIRIAAVDRPNVWRIWHERLAAAIRSGQWDPDAERDWFAKTWSPMIPAGDCNCADNWRPLLRANPVDWSTADAALESSRILHNLVSRNHSGRPELTAAQVRFLYLQEPPTRERCVVTVATGHKFRELLNYSRPSLVAYAGTVDADYYELTDTQFPDWKREKFRVYDFARAYGRTLFVDADCWIRPSCPDLFELVAADRVGMHDDYPFQVSTDWLARARSELFAAEGIDAPPDAPHCYNSGVVVCSRESADIWAPPRNPLPPIHVAEQLLIEYRALSRGNLQPLPRSLNCQFWMRDFAAAAESAEIIHLADCPAKLAELKKWAAAGLGKQASVPIV